jgi:hypothetical protein
MSAIRSAFNDVKSWLRNMSNKTTEIIFLDVVDEAAVEALLSTVVKSFISYTTEIYRIKYYDEWNSKIETLRVDDSFEVEFSSNRSDIMAFDD